MSTTKALHRPIAILKMPRRVPAVITYAQGVVSAMSGNAAFPTPKRDVEDLVDGLLEDEEDR